MADSERVADAEMDAPVPLLGHAVHEQTGNRRELKSEIRAHDADGSGPAKPGAGVGAQRTEGEMQIRGPDVAGVDEEDAPELAANRKPDFAGRLHHRLTADGKTGRRQRRHFVAAPAAQTRGAAEKIAR